MMMIVEFGDEVDMLERKGCSLMIKVWGYGGVFVGAQKGFSNHVHRDPHLSLR